MGAPVHIANDAPRMIAGVFGRTPYRYHAAVSIMVGAVEPTPSMTFHRHHGPTERFSVDNRIFDIFVRMTTSRHLSTPYSFLLSFVNTHLKLELLAAVPMQLPSRPKRFREPDQPFERLGIAVK